MSTPSSELKSTNLKIPDGTTPSGNRAILKNSSRRLSSAFKSPLRISNNDKSQSTNEETNLKEEIRALREREFQIDKEIDALITEGYRDDELNSHIQKLHDYNEIKDIGQMILGRIAVQKGTTTKDLYEKYSLNMDD